MVPRDPQHAERWHLAAAKQGHLDSQLQLCASFLDGRGGPERFTDAAEWCRLASDQGDAEAAFRLANLYAKGEGVEPDRAAANRLYQAAAEGVSLRLRSSSVSTTPPTATFPSTWCRRTAG